MWAEILAGSDWRTRVLFCPRQRPQRQQERCDRIKKHCYFALTLTMACAIIPRGMLENAALEVLNCLRLIWAQDPAAPGWKTDRHTGTPQFHAGSASRCLCGRHCKHLKCLSLSKKKTVIYIPEQSMHEEDKVFNSSRNNAVCNLQKIPRNNEKNCCKPFTPQHRLFLIFRVNYYARSTSGITVLRMKKFRCFGDALWGENFHGQKKKKKLLHFLSQRIASKSSAECQI